MKAVSKSLLAWGLVAALASSAAAQTVSPYQSAYRPWGYSLASKVYLSGSDSLSAAFNNNLTTYVNQVKTYLPETVAFTGIGLNQLNPQSLYFQFAYAPRVYFLYEGACYTDALGCTIATVSTPTNKPTTGTNYLLFPDQKYSLSWICASGSGVRSASEPLAPGDFVQLPTINPGQQLAFFMGSNLNTTAASNSSQYGQPANTYYNGSASNSDGFQHLIAFFPDNSQYIIIGFEDLDGGGDQDCNDLMFVVDVGPNNAAAWRAPTTMAK